MVCYTGPMDKRELRRNLRRSPPRGGVDRTDQADQADEIDQLRALARFLDREVPADRRVVLYDAMPGEVPLDGLVAAHPDPGGRYALTRTPEAGHRLTVHPWGGPTERHRYGYRQPRLDAPVVADAEIGAVVVPGLAFDPRGNRLGHGGGYYDRFLARLGPAVLRIGIGGARVERLPAEDHDVAMTHLAGPDGVVAVRPGPGRDGSTSG